MAGYDIVYIVQRDSDAVKKLISGGKRRPDETRSVNKVCLQKRERNYILRRAKFFLSVEIVDGTSEILKLCEDEEYKKWKVCPEKVVKVVYHGNI